MKSRNDHLLQVFVLSSKMYKDRMSWTKVVSALWHDSSWSATFNGRIKGRSSYQENYSFGTVLYNHWKYRFDQNTPDSKRYFILFFLCQWVLTSLCIIEDSVKSCPLFLRSGGLVFVIFVVVKFLLVFE